MIMSLLFVSFLVLLCIKKGRYSLKKKKKAGAKGKKNYSWGVIVSYILLPDMILHDFILSLLHLHRSICTETKIAIFQWDLLGEKKKA